MSYTFYGAASITNSLRTNVAPKTSNPGPGAYEPTVKNYYSLPKWTLKQKHNYGSCFQNNSITPSPGTYEFKKKSQRKIKDLILSTKYKSFGQKSSSMSPLNIPSGINTKCGYTFGSRQQVVVKESSPGPIYDISKEYLEERMFKKKNNCKGFGFGDRNGIYKNLEDTPGPGAYHSESRNKQASNWTFSKQKKSSLQYPMKQNIGPGQYSPKMPQSPKACVIKGKYPQPKKEMFNTGPGAYNLPENKSKKGGRFNTNSKQKAGVLLGNCKQTPSPFHYNPRRYPQTMSSSAGFSMAGSLRDKRCYVEEQSPGPGSYEVRKDQINQMQGGYMGKKLPSKKKNIVDNFYKYSPNVQAICRQTPKYSFGNSLYGRDPNYEQDKSFDKLGPGSYDIQSKKSQMYSFGKDQRWKLSEVPPFYNHKNTDQMFQTIGFMPKYLKKGGAKFSKHTKQNQLNNSKIQGNNSKTYNA